MDLGLDGKNQEAASNFLLASAENIQYIVTVDALNEIFELQLKQKKL